MTVKIYVAKYVADVRRWEPRNVGVIVQHEEGIAARFLAEESDSEKIRINRKKARYLVNDSSVYEQWVRHWRLTATRGPDALAASVAQKSPNYFLLDAGEVFSGEDVFSADELLDHYFSVLVAVTRESDPPAEALKLAVDALISKVRLPLVRDFVLESVDLTPSEKYTFQYGYQNGRITVAQRVPLGQTRDVHDVLWKLEHLPKEVGRVTFVSPAADEEATPLLAHLGQRSTVVDVGRPEAPDILVQAFTSN